MRVFDTKFLRTFDDELRMCTIRNLDLRVIHTPQKISVSVLLSCEPGQFIDDAAPAALMIISRLRATQSRVAEGQLSFVLPQSSEAKGHCTMRGRVF